MFEFSDKNKKVFLAVFTRQVKSDSAACITGHAWDLHWLHFELCAFEVTRKAEKNKAGQK